jgi:hypothetical protein
MGGSDRILRQVLDFDKVVAVHRLAVGPHKERIAQVPPAVGIVAVRRGFAPERRWVDHIRRA